jgi:hypothetical protein
MIIEFTSDYGTKTKGTKVNADAGLASSLIKKGVAIQWQEKLVKETKEPKKAKVEEPKPKE